MAVFHVLLFVFSQTSVFLVLNYYYVSCMFSPNFYPSLGLMAIQSMNILCYVPNMGAEKRKKSPTKVIFVIYLIMKKMQN
jgi:hypothetical protein